MDKIIELIKEEADTVNKSNPISRLYNVDMEIQARLIKEIVKTLEQKENADKN